MAANDAEGRRGGERTTASASSTLAAAERALVDAFLGHLGNERRLSSHTIEAYRRDVGRLAVFLGRRDVVSWRMLRQAHARAFAAELHGRGLSGRSIQRMLSAGRAFFRFLVREHAVTHNPFDGVAAPKASRRLPRTLSAEQVARLAEAPGADPLAVRDRAIIELLYSSGLRLAELMRLDIGDVDFNDATVRVLGKGAKTRVVPVGRYARGALEAWLTARQGLAADGELALFVGRGGHRLGGRSVQRRLQLWALRQGIGCRVHPHLLRHSFASHILESSSDLRGVQELLGHANIATTQIYTHLDFQQLAKVYDRAHPHARKRSG